MFGVDVALPQDPEKMLEQTVAEMQEDLIKMRQASAQVMASQKQLEARYKQAEAAEADWYKRAQLALQKGDEELAREALKRRKAAQENAGGMRAQLEQQTAAVERLVANTRLLEGKLGEAKSKKDTLKARAQSAKASQRANEMVGGLSTTNALAAFERMEEKVMAMEAEADATALLTGGDDLSKQFKALEGGDEVDAELAAMRRGLLGAGPAGGASKGALPAGRISYSADPAIEAELLGEEGGGDGCMRGGGTGAAALRLLPSHPPSRALILPSWTRSPRAFTDMKKDRS